MICISVLFQLLHIAVYLWLNVVLNNRRLPIRCVCLSYKQQRFYASVSIISPITSSDFSWMLAETEQDTHQESELLTVFHRDINSLMFVQKVNGFLRMFCLHFAFYNHRLVNKPLYVRIEAEQLLEYVSLES